jgi:hypothetical protein
VASGDDTLHHGAGKRSRTASAADDQAPKTLGSRDFFTHYTERCEAAAAGGNVEVLPLEIVAETNYKA